MENPIITTKDSVVMNGNLSYKQVTDMASHNKFTTLTKKQRGWEFFGVGRTDTNVIPWKFRINGDITAFCAIQHKNMHGTEQITIFKTDKKFTYDLDSMVIVAEYCCYIDLKSAIEKFIEEK